MASKFLTFSSNNENLNHDLRIKKFQDQLKAQKNIADWQVKQANEALHLYVYSFLDGDKSTLSPNALQTNKKLPEVSKIISEIRQAIRIKHYSYSTERTYIDWVKSFFNYTLSIKKKDIQISGIDSNDIKDYLSYLALKRRVSASTQNQALNALLFLFRNVLKIELGDLSKTVRAKRGQRLPVVFTVEEVEELFKHVKGISLLILQLLYGSGLRLMELARLRVKDIDFSSSLIFVRSGKGDKDSSTILPESIKTQLQLHLGKVKKLHKENLTYYEKILRLHDEQ